MDQCEEEPVSVPSTESRLKKLLSHIFSKRVFIALALGQCLSLFICGTAVTSGLLEENGVFIPTGQSFLNYALLTLVYTTWMAFRRNDSGSLFSVFKLRGWKYFILAAVDVEANYLIVKAYQYTTVTSVQLLDCFTIPTVLLLSWFILKVRYKWLHIAGVVLCLLGVVSLVVSDVLVGKNTGTASNKLLGDGLCLAGAVLYGASNVGQEYFVRSFDRVEFLGMIGLFGAFINALQFVLLERKELASLQFTPYQIGLLVGFALCLFLLYSLMPVVMKITSATSVNLNLLSADFYALLFGLFLFHYKFHPLYFVSFTVILVGIVVYSLKPPPTLPATTDNENTSQHSEEDTEIGQSTNVAHETDSLILSTSQNSTSLPRNDVES